MALRMWTTAAGTRRSFRFLHSAAVGQPASHTHPHLVQPHELTPGIPKAEFAARRRALMDLLPPDSVVLLAGKRESLMAHDIPYPFRQDPDFFYLTGFQEPDALLLLQGGDAELTLLVRPRDPAKEVWDGPCAGVEGALKVFGADEAYPLAQAGPVVQAALAKCKGQIWAPSNRLPERVVQLMSDSTIRGDPTPWLHQLRAVKSVHELELMQRAASISAQSFCDAIKAQRTISTEHQLAAQLEFGFKMRGAQKLAYPCVVAGGNNANTLHYISNDQPLNPGTTVLVDAGCEYNGYASDITRCWPVDGVFNEAQRELYEAVLRVQLACIDKAREGVTHTKLHQFSVEVTCEELRRLGLITGNNHNGYYALYPHSIGHHLGIDVHDVPLIRGSAPFVPGNVITIEPGIYVPDSPSVPERFRGIGVRIEDDIVITEGGAPPIVLTSDVPKEADEIEQLMRS